MKSAWKLYGLESLENRSLLSVSANDPLLYKQWGLGSANLKNAWNYTTGSDSVVVAVIDSGIDLLHEDLKKNIWVNPGEIPGDNVDNDNNGYVDDINGWNFVNNSNNVQDGYGHGTHISGIIGAEGGNGVGVAGINWNVKIMPLKFMDDRGVGDTGGVIDAMSYAIKMKRDYGVNVVAVNGSWGGGTGYSNMLYNKIGELKDNNMMFVTAAGNAGSDSDAIPRYPGSFDQDNIINVGALSSDGYSLTSYSNYGVKNVDIAAPGAMVYSTFPNNNYAYMSGTSMAAPFVSGTVALINSLKPNMSVAEAKGVIFGSVDKVYSLFDKVYTGGKLNVGAAICQVLNIPYIHNILPEGAIVSSTLTTISGWARDPDGTNTLVKMIVDGAEKGVVGVAADYSFSFNLGGLTIGAHSIEIYAQDSSSGEWKNIGSTIVNIPAPVVKVNYASSSRISGWAFSERSGASSVIVRVVINGRVVRQQVADQYRPSLVGMVGSSYHGFNIALNRNWFRRGANVVNIQVFDPLSQQVSIAWRAIVRR